MTEPKLETPTDFSGPPYVPMVHRCMLGFYQAGIAPGETKLVGSVPYLPFRGEEILVPAHLAEFFDIEQVFVGYVSSMRSASPVPCKALSAKNKKREPLWMDPAQIGQTVALAVKNRSLRSGHFYAGIMGSAFVEMAPSALNANTPGFRALRALKLPYAELRFESDGLIPVGESVLISRFLEDEDFRPDGFVVDDHCLKGFLISSIRVGVCEQGVSSMSIHAGCFSKEAAPYLFLDRAQPKQLISVCVVNVSNQPSAFGATMRSGSAVPSLPERPANHPDRGPDRSGALKIAFSGTIPARSSGVVSRTVQTPFRPGRLRFNPDFAIDDIRVGIAHNSHRVLEPGLLELFGPSDEGGEGPPLTGQIGQTISVVVTNPSRSVAAFQGVMSGEAVLPAGFDEALYAKYFLETSGG
jgi:hypothetical protein